MRKALRLGKNLSHLWSSIMTEIRILLIIVCWFNIILKKQKRHLCGDGAFKIYTNFLAISSPGHRASDDFNNNDR